MQQKHKTTSQQFDPPRITATPLTHAFDSKYAIHAGMMGGLKVEENLEEKFINEVRQTPAQQSAMAYIHIPFCSSRCLFCGFYSQHSTSESMTRYTGALLEEITHTGQILRDAGQTLGAIYFGGGTPTDLDAKALRELLQAVRRELPLTADCEITLEGRLYGFDDPKIEAALEGGANRFSFGIQSFNTAIRQRVGRRQPKTELLQRLERIVELAAPYRAAVVIDLIYGLPGQEAPEWLEDIDCAVADTGIHGLDLYQINIIQGTPLDKKRAGLPPMATLSQQALLFACGRERMIEAGFQRLSIAHWGRDPRERNRYNRWNKLGVNCIPLGCGAGGRWGAMRVFQDNDLGRYQESIRAGKKPLAMGIRVPDYAAVVAVAIGELEQRQLNIARLEESARCSLAEPLLPFLEQWESAGLLRLQSNGIHRLSVAGEFWSVNLQQLLSVQLKELLALS